MFPNACGNQMSVEYLDHLVQSFLYVFNICRQKFTILCVLAIFDEMLVENENKIANSQDFTKFSAQIFDFNIVKTGENIEKLIS